ncbi:MAG: hypothetical protein ACI9D0_000771, partial [Bacteroidia bacterium]
SWVKHAPGLKGVRADFTYRDLVLGRCGCLVLNQGAKAAAESFGAHRFYI